MAEPSRNVELKAHDHDPARTLERALAAGAEDRGVLRQRDTYFVVAHGRLKLREEVPGGATLIGYERPDAASERVSDYRLVPIAEPAALLAALSAANGVSTQVDKRRRLLIWEQTVRIHLDEVSGLGEFLELEAVAAPGSDLTRERGQVARLRELLAIADDALLDGSYADLLARAGAAEPDRGLHAPAGAAEPDPELLALARQAAGRAYAPYSNFPVGAAVRTADGRRYAGANVENAAYPQGQCAEASAIGALVAGGGGAIAEVVVAAPSRELCTPCGGCRQRLREFTADDAPIHLVDLARVRRTTTLAELLPLSFGPENLVSAAATIAARAPGFKPRLGLMLGSGLGELAERLEERVEISYGELPGFHAGGLAGHAGALVLGRLAGQPVAIFSGRWHVYEGIEGGAITTPVRTLKQLGAELLLLTNAAGSLRPETGPGSLVCLSDHINMLGFNPLTGPNEETAGPRFPSLRDAYDPTCARACTPPRTRSGSSCTTASISPSPGPASRRRPRSARSACSAPTSSA